MISGYTIDNSVTSKLGNFMGASTSNGGFSSPKASSLEQRISAARSWAKAKKEHKNEGFEEEDVHTTDRRTTVYATSKSSDGAHDGQQSKASNHVNAEDIRQQGSSNTKPAENNTIVPTRLNKRNQRSEAAPSDGGEGLFVSNADFEEAKQGPRQEGVKGEHIRGIRPTSEISQAQNSEPVVSKEQLLSPSNASPEPVIPLASNPYAGLKAKKRSQAERPNEWAPPKKAKRDVGTAINVDIKSSMPKGRSAKGFRAQLPLFTNTYEEIGRIQEDLRQGKGCDERLQKLRTYLQRIAVCDYSDKRHFSESRLEKEKGLKAIFRTGSDFPYDIQADAKALFFMLSRGIYNMNILRGINIQTRVTDGKSHKTSLYDTTSYRMSCNQYGMNHLVNGQWWPTQLACGRDGAHGSAEGGIHGNLDGGTYSIILSDGYKDEDHGDTIEYCGTAGSEPNKPTRNTECMKQSLRTGNEVRVLRSAAMKKDRKYRPKRGFRLDGVYRVIGQECVHEETSMWRFIMTRVPGQDPIRFSGPEQRPSQYEIAAFDARP